VKLVDGENNCFPPTKAELNLIGTNYFIDGRRLSCQVRCFGDITVDLTEQVDKAENQTKKIRGYRQQGKQNESHAVNDTMLLNEKIDVSQNSQEDKRSDEGPGPQAQGGQKQQQQAQNRQRQNQPQQQQKNKQQQGQGRGNQGNNQGGQQQGQGKSQNKSQDKPQGRRRR
jgi:hypothetical protein